MSKNPIGATVVLATIKFNTQMKNIIEKTLSRDPLSAISDKEMKEIKEYTEEYIKNVTNIEYISKPEIYIKLIKAVLEGRE